MKAKLRKFCRATVAVLSLSLCGMAGRLGSPSVAFPAGVPTEYQTNVVAALTHPDYKFIGGEFLNSSTWLYYAGNTKALSLFLERMSKCPGTIISVKFVPQIEMEETATWSVSHFSSGAPKQFYVEVNLGSQQLRLEELALPDIK